MSLDKDVSAELAHVVELLKEATPGLWSQDTGGAITRNDGTALFEHAEFNGIELDERFANTNAVEAAVNFLRKHGTSLLSSHGGGGEAVGHVTTIDGKVSVNWYHGPLPDGAELFAAPQHARQSAEPRFFIEHGVVHDRQTGKHVGAANEDDGAKRLLALLKSLENDRDAWRMTAKSFSAATPPPQPRAEGMVLVPREPTPEMLSAQAGAMPTRRAMWTAMIAAAPGEGSAP